MAEPDLLVLETDSMHREVRDALEEAARATRSLGYAAQGAFETATQDAFTNAAPGELCSRGVRLRGAAEHIIQLAVELAAVSARLEALGDVVSAQTPPQSAASS